MLKTLIKEIDGSWSVAAAHLGMTRDALENRVYEKKGQTLWLEDILELQAHADSTLFAEWIAQRSGGTFVKLPDVEHFGNEELLAKFNELYAELGRLSMEHNDALGDNIIDKGEAGKLTARVAEIHQTLEELLALTFKIYKRG